MHPELITLPGGLTVRTYGLCLAIAFLTGTLLARRRAVRAEANPDVVLRTALLAAIFGVGGARLFYVVHYWPRFAREENPLLAIINFRKGGLEFLGGFVCGTMAIIVYLLLLRRRTARRGQALPIRLYLDVLSPSLMWGLAITRIGCFFNGCCFGAICVIPDTEKASRPWAISFPYGSPPFAKHWSEGRVAPPPELIVTSGKRKRLFPSALLASDSSEKLPGYLKHKLELPSPRDPSRSISLAELRAIAADSRSLPIHPTQLYATVNAVLLSGLLASLFSVRKRHGVVFAAMLILYPISRFLLEMIRSDNPHDTFGLTASQFVSVAMFTLGLAVLAVLYTYFPDCPPGFSADRRPHANVGQSISDARGKPPRRVTKSSGAQRTHRAGRGRRRR